MMGVSSGGVLRYCAVLRAKPTLLQAWRSEMLCSCIIA
jgi:hypothetical protein